MQYCVKYRAILDHVITALVCIQLFCEFARSPSQLNEDFIILILLFASIKQIFKHANIELY